LFKTAGVIPIASAKEDPELLEAAFDAIDHALANGEAVCIFPEGELTRSGAINPFRPGLERIIARRPVPVVPMALSGLWGTFFSRAGKGAMRRLPKPLWFRVNLRIGEKVAADEATAALLEARVAALVENNTSPS
jgi:1-acyl-sn-glycerol-3-phosphate acyltransferase